VVVSGNLLGELDLARLLVIALAHGLAIALLISAVAHHSGGHINPAVTFAAMLTGKTSFAQGILNIAAQIVGGIVAAILLGLVLPESLGGGLGNGGLGSHGLGEGVGPFRGVVMEFFGTALLVFVVFGAAMDKRGVGNLAPLAIGLAVLVDHLVLVPLTGASMNPARTLGPAIAASNWDAHWIYWVGPLAGGAVAGIGYKMIFEQKQSS